MTVSPRDDANIIESQPVVTENLPSKKEHGQPSEDNFQEGGYGWYIQFLTIESDTVSHTEVKLTMP